MKFTQEGGVYVRIFSLKKSYGINLCIEVSDTGRGISLIDQGRVFERFFRCDAGRDKETGGTGLGLAIVKEIINAHKQNINVISTVGVGTEFIFTLEKAK